MAENKIVECEGVLCKHFERNCEWAVDVLEHQKEEEKAGKNQKNKTLRNPIRSYYYY